MAHLSRSLRRIKQGFSRTRNLFACADFGANATNSANDDVPPPVEYKEPRPERTLQMDNPSDYTIHVAEEPLSQPFVVWEHGGSVNNYTADGQSFDVQGLRPLTENQPKLLRIVGVAIAFRDPPSVLRISQVLSLPEEEVRRSVRTIANHLHTLVDFTKVELPAGFVSQMYRSCLQIMGAAHGDIACWCLQGAMKLLPRDIDYALSYWAWQVSQATPSVKLTRALEEFPFVLCSVRQSQLSDVIHWLKDCNLPEAAPLVEQYEHRLNILAELLSSER
ncbi:hypothetical protein MSAN_00972500 [Mycena sanguinolenta]|uniref:Uncharacterized protein n=1 Tax=Mycena sanguinolenta TaxID=230812 RepID=A0A8H6YTZ6_9AGAR|nr:hypothetical protein MSAN_00972500 [Mycena sanguinolenta]